MILNILFVAAMIVCGYVHLYFRKHKGQGISLLVPFHIDDETSQRAENWRWLKRYWKHCLPNAEIIMGEDIISKNDPSIPFSKSVAVNNAASKAKGDILVIVDADAYVSAFTVLECARQIREARKRKQRLWFVPYRQFYRLTQEASRLVLNSFPTNPYQFSDPPPPDCILNMSGSQFGHWYGAMIQIVPREAFDEIGGWVPRFRGWGGEDHAIMRATDTLYWRHKTLPGQVLHLWHPMRSSKGTDAWVDWQNRIWDNQTESGVNDQLSGRYYGANGDIKRMRKLVEEGKCPDRLKH